MGGGTGVWCWWCCLCSIGNGAGCVTNGVVVSAGEEMANIGRNVMSNMMLTKYFLDVSMASIPILFWQDRWPFYGKIPM